MKLIYKFFIFLLTLFIICISLILAAASGYLDKSIKATVELYLHYKGLKANINSLHFKGNKLSINNISFDLIEETKAFINKAEIAFSLDGTIRTPLIIAKTNLDNLTIITKDKQQILATSISAEYQLKLFSASSKTRIQLDSIKSKILSDLNGTNLPVGSAVCNYNTRYIFKGYKSADCRISFGGKSFLSINSTMKAKEIKAHGLISNIPIMIYQIARKIIPSNDVILFLDKYIHSGHLSSGQFNLHLDKRFFEDFTLKAENLSGQFKVADVELEYDKDFPPLTKLEMDIILSGSLTKFLINKAYINNTFVKNGVVTLDWRGVDSSNVIVSATSNGPAADLTGFILAETHKKIQKKGIDIQKLTGTANTKIAIIIPINPKIKTTYNITTEIKDAGLRILNNNIELSQGSLQGCFNGNEIVLTGKARINDFVSDLDYHHDLTIPKINQHSLKIKTRFQGSNQKLGFIRLISGNGILNFEYKGKNGQATITANSNLKGIEFYLDKIAIHKKRGEAANLNLQGNFASDSKSDNIEFALVGDNNLKIVANVAVTDNKHHIVAPIISHYDTNLRAEIISSPNNFRAELHGSTLDLSQANMKQFLEKERDNVVTQLKVNLDKIQLKNRILLTDVELALDCNKTKCFSGHLDSKIGTKSLKMLLKQADDKEEWIINCDNAGAILKGVGIYNNMKRGTMLIIVDTKRQLAKSGEIVPIVDGIFTFRKFATTDHSFLAGLVSYLSVPGLQNFLTNSKNIEFLQMGGKFNYIGDIITISDTSVEGPYFDFTIYGTIDTTNRKVKLKGGVMPSVYGLSTILKKIPILGTILSGGHRKGIFSAPYSIEKEY